MATYSYTQHGEKNLKRALSNKVLDKMTDHPEGIQQKLSQAKEAFKSKAAQNKGRFRISSCSPKPRERPHNLDLLCQKLQVSFSGLSAAVPLCRADVSNLITIKMRLTYVYIYNLKPVDGPLKNRPQSQLQISKTLRKEITLLADVMRMRCFRFTGLLQRARTELINRRIPP